MKEIVAPHNQRPDHDIRKIQFWGFAGLIFNLGLPFLDFVLLLLLNSFWSDPEFLYTTQNGCNRVRVRRSVICACAPHLAVGAPRAGIEVGSWQSSAHKLTDHRSSELAAICIGGADACFRWQLTGHEFCSHEDMNEMTNEFIWTELTRLFAAIGSVLQPTKLKKPKETYEVMDCRWTI